MNSENRDLTLLVAKAKYYQHLHDRYERLEALRSANLYSKKAQAKMDEIEEPNASRRGHLYINK